MNVPAIATDASIYTSSAAWHEVSREKTRLVFLLADFLNEKIKLTDFGSGLHGIWFVALIMPPDDTIHSNRIVFHRKKQELAIYWKMDYEQVMSSSTLSFKAYLAHFFIDVLNLAKEKKKIDQFNFDAFINAVALALPEWVDQATN